MSGGIFRHNRADPLDWRLPLYNDMRRGMGAALEPFGRAVRIAKTDAEIAEMARATGETEAGVRELLAESARWPLFKNDTHQVELRASWWGGDPDDVMVHLSVKRLDREAIHDWRHLQEIKNRICGPEFEAVELYPAETRVVDLANQYHLWVCYERGWRFPFGFSTGRRDYTTAPGAHHRQRPLG